MKLLHTFVNTGEMPDVQYCADDALVNYLAETMRDVQLKALVQSDVIAARIFVDTMAQFIQLFLQKLHINSNAAVLKKTNRRSCPMEHYKKT